MKTEKFNYSISNISSFIFTFLIGFSIGFYFVFYNVDSHRDEIFLAVGIIFASVFLYFTLRQIQTPYKHFLDILKVLKSDNGREIINESFSADFEPFKEKLNELITEIHDATFLIKEIENGGSSSLDESSHNLKDSVLLSAILNMKLRMANIAKEEKNRIWTSEGISLFSEILRNNQDDLVTLSNSIVANLCKYIHANQGGLFIYTEESNEKYLQLLACYAYNRRKYLAKRINIGEGLVGQCYLEKQEIFLTNLPSEYINITSGLGNATPKCLLIVPLILNEQVYGVIELASFEVFEQYQIEFVKKMAESIASTISNALTSKKTNDILNELQSYTAQMKEQEEELRQNMEELKSTQEEMVRKERQVNRLLEESKQNEKLLEAKLEEIEEIKKKENENTQKMLSEMDYNHKIMLQVIDQLPEKIFLKDEEGKFLLLNTAIAAGYNKQVSELIGTGDFDHFSFEQATQYRNVELEMLKNNEPIAMYEDFVDANSNARILYSVKMPFKFPKKTKPGILGYQVDVTDIKLLEKKVLEAEKKMINNLNSN